MITCSNCFREVVPTKGKFSFLLFFLLMLLWVFPAFIYVLWYATRQPHICPCCGKNVYFKEEKLGSLHQEVEKHCKDGKYYPTN
ncbi:MAG: hypothetical protein ACRCX8_14530 [Sarcina sp.]